MGILYCELCIAHCPSSIDASGGAASPFAAVMMDVTLDASSGGMVEIGSLSIHSRGSEGTPRPARTIHPLSLAMSGLDGEMEMVMEMENNAKAQREPGEDDASVRAPLFFAL